MRRLAHPGLDERGQVLPIFALLAVFMVGALSLAIDYGFLTDQHRNLQALADHAAIAGAEQLSTDGNTTAARRYAMIYIRDNLGISKTVFDLSGATAPCKGSTPSFAPPDPFVCVLPAPYDNYDVQLSSPGPSNRANGGAVQTIAVTINDSVTNGMAAVIGVARSTVGAYAEARATPPGARLTAALYTDGCINTATTSVVGTPLIVDGDVYVNQCTVAQNGLIGGFCSFPTPTTAGNLVFGPTATPPAGLVLNLGLGCSVPLAGLLNLGVGNALQVPTSAFPTGLPAPPPGPNVCGADCSADHLCKNGTVNDHGVAPMTCYDPGVYQNNPLENVHNNLNPGVYYVDIGGGGCYNDTTVTSCGGVYFQGSTMNANVNGVIHSCWSNGPVGGFGLTAASQTFTAPCPDGLIYDPTKGFADPQTGTSGCGTAIPSATDGYGGFLGLVHIFDAFSAAPSAAGGSLAARNYSVRVSALSTYNSVVDGLPFGETAAEPEQTVTVAGGGTGSIGVTITASPTAKGGHNVYVSTASNQEQLVATLPAATTSYTIKNLAPAGAQHYPIFNNSACSSSSGFHNIPHSKDQGQNYGVTFVLTGKAGFCMGTDSGDQHCQANLPGPGITVLVQPYCSAGFTPQPESLACSGAGVAGPNLEDGVYTVYGSSEGAIRTSPSAACGLLCPVTGLMGVTGTVYLPRGSMVEDTGSMFTNTPGQVVAHDVKSNLNLGLLTPFAYANTATGAFLTPGAFLVQ